MNKVKTVYDIKYEVNKAGEQIVWLYKNNKPMHSVNVDHLAWEHFEKNGWTK